ncbi:MAG TPA: glycoside hydrolase family 38 C-terminal domain-containing protein, partial [Verrucomicrobiae bacterium]|nr:glycoside hydrolase family 38 C-terminal domain-containing protein [Verrucomicrobiae bacterium]
RLGARRAELPVHDDELYLEYHRGTYTTHHDVKAGNAALERKLAWAETLAAWCVAVRAPRAALDRVRGALHGAWEIVLRNQFHDVLPGTSIAEVYADVREEHARANVLADEAAAAARALLPRAAPPRSAPLRPPDATSEGFEFGNGFVEARVLPNGTLTDLRVAGGGNAVAQANLLAHYPDRPKKWEAWNIDAGYERRRRAAVPGAAKLVDGGLEVPFRIGRRSLATMRLTLREGDPYLRVELAVDWRERRTLLRLENWLAVRAEEAIYGAPHGTVTRSARADTAQRRARFEVPGQRFALVRDGEGTGVALFSLDAYGWSARALAKGGVRLGHSLLRSTGWPDPRADAGEAAFAWAFAPVRGAGVGAVESAWRRFAGDEGVPLFESGDDAIAVVACKPAHDGDGVIVRIRECDGAARPFALRCGGRMREAIPVDGVERRVPGDARIEGESLAGEIAAYALRSWRVRF